MIYLVVVLLIVLNSNIAILVLLILVYILLFPSRLLALTCERREMKRARNALMLEEPIKSSPLYVM